MPSHLGGRGDPPTRDRGPTAQTYPAFKAWFSRIFSFTKIPSKKPVLKTSFKNLQKNLATNNQLNTKSTKDFLKEMEAGAKKWSRKGTQKWTLNRTPFGEPRCSETQGIQYILEFLASQRGPVLGSFWIHLGPIPGPKKSGTFQEFY